MIRSISKLFCMYMFYFFYSLCFSFILFSDFSSLLFSSFILTSHDPARNALILHNTSSNSLQLVTPNSTHHDPEFSLNSQICPHCGQPLAQGLNSFKKFASNTYVNNKYFKLLAAATNDAAPDSDFDSAFSYSASSSKSIPTQHLPQNLFTPNYFSKFFKIDKLLGSGSNGSVYKVEHFINNFSLGYFAVKKIPIGDDIKGLSKILKEVEFLCLLSTSSKNLVKYNHVWLEISQATSFGPQVPCAFILTEYCDGGNLENLVYRLKNPENDIETQKNRIRQRRRSRKGGKVGKVSEPQSRLLSSLEILKFFKDIVTGVNELHDNHIIHRDLKPSNCLISTRYEEKLAFDPSLESQFDPTLYTKFKSLPSILISDFGESQFEGKSRNSSGSTGTLEFVAPELLAKKRTENGPGESLNNFNRKSDIFGLGMILFFMCFGQLPYKSISEEDNDYSLLKSQISNFDISSYLQSPEFAKQYRNDLPEEIYNLLELLLDRTASKRPTAEELSTIVLNIISKQLTTAEESTITLPEQVSPKIEQKKYSYYKMIILSIEAILMNVIIKAYYSRHSNSPLVNYVDGIMTYNKLMLVNVFFLGVSISSNRYILLFAMIMAIDIIAFVLQIFSSFSF